MSLTTTSDTAAHAVRQAGGTPPQIGLRIGEWVLDTRANRLCRGRREAKLEPKVADLLRYLAGHANQVVSRQELEGAVWRGTVVGYDSVTGGIQKLRRALEDDRRRPRYIETLSKRGYRLIAPVRDLPSSQQAADLAIDEVSADRRARNWRARGKHLLDGLVLVALIVLSAAGLWLSQDPPATMAAADERFRLSPALPLLVAGSKAHLAAHDDQAMIEALLAGRRQLLVAAALGGDSTVFAAPGDIDTRALAEVLATQHALADSIRSGLPVSPSRYHLHRGQLYYAIGRYRDAIDALQQGLLSNPASESLHLWLAASFVEVGELDDARWERKEVLLANPGFSLAEAQAHFPYTHDASTERLKDRLREIGLDR
jgi:DNA-binding winged helix-turn-helix (wHTH) protein